MAQFDFNVKRNQYPVLSRLRARHGEFHIRRKEILGGVSNTVLAKMGTLKAPLKNTPNNEYGGVIL